MPPLTEEESTEFPMGAADFSDGVSRRRFLQLLGSSVALAGAAGCTRAPSQKVLPYSRRPEGMIPGKPLHYATSATLAGFATGLLVESNEGRPTKVEGNPLHPASLGGSGILEQAVVLQLYDPHRAQLVRRRGTPGTWLAFRQAMEEKTKQLKAQGGGERLRFLLEPTASPLVADLRERVLAELPRARFYSYAPLAEDDRYEGARLAFGRPAETLYHFERAKVVVALDADFLASMPSHLRNARGWAQGRGLGEQRGRLYAVESMLSPTGGAADHRLRLRSAEVKGFALAVLRELVEGGPAGLTPGAPLDRLRAALARLRFEAADPKWVRAVAADLRRNPGKGLVVAGPRQPAVVHAAAHALNALLGNAGATATHAETFVAEPAGPRALQALVEEMRAGAVETLAIAAVNPVYAAPVDLGFAEALAKVPTSIYQGLYEDETSPHAAWFLPAAHELESWGDGRAQDGTVSLRQPLIDPLYGGTTPAELLALFLGEADRGAHQLLMDFWRRSRASKDFGLFWDEALQKGLVEGSGLPEQALPVRWEGLVAELERAAVEGKGAEGLEVGFFPDAKVYDGRFANNAWLQELPDPATKLTWDNAALMSPRTAERLGVKTEDLVELLYRGRSVRAPVSVLPGHADGSVSLALGYGRAGAEAVARGVGFNAYVLRSSDAPWFGQGLEIAKVGGHHRLALTQEHWRMEGRPLAMDLTPAELEREPSPLEPLRVPLPTLYESVPYPSYRWAAAVDLDKCFGCGACVVACQAENNIPVVGKEGVARSREMQWLRIDRYFSGPEEDPTIVTQPVACVHCENAPCEYVCPVNATVHSDEGLNEMVYNRCVGTRYCSNNCPYKVRRFNFLDYRGEKTPVEKMVMNPDVSVRSRGVMEKCTYCVQRIERARIEARIEGRAIRDGEIQTACQQSCPAQAIVFGTLSDTGSRVSQMHADKRRYDLLHELNTRPRTAYLARVRNVNPELA